MDLAQVFSPIAEKFGKKDENIERFLAVKISRESVFATVWFIEDGHVRVGKIGSAKMASAEFDELLKAVDKAITDATTEHPDVSKTIFAVPLESIQEGRIVPDELSKLRRICKELDLYPLGYVVTYEALEQYFKETEGSPLSAILVGLDGKKVAVSVVKAGKEVNSINFERSETPGFSLPAEIEKALKQFNHADALPSRIILYDGDLDLSKIANELTAYSWMGKLPFLHFPKVEKVSSEFVVTAVATLGGLQMGGKLSPMESESTESTPTPEEPPTSELVEVNPEEAGFTTFEGEREKEPEVKVLEPQKKEGPNLATTAVATLSEVLGKAKSLVSFKSGQHSPPKFIYIAAALVVLVIVLFGVSYYMLPKVSVITYVDSQEFNKELTASVVTADSISTQGAAIPGEFVQTTQIGTKRSVATGQKLVGKRATGQVTIYSVAEGKSFPADTVINSPTGLKFTLEKDVTVASGDAVSAATVTVPIRAGDIGDSFNLAPGTRFTIGSLSSSDYLAKNESAFSGGESHMATVVTKADQDRLMASLSAELAEKALVDLQAEIKSNQTLLPNAVTSTIAKKKFSKDLDSEADTVSLDLTVDYKGVVFSRDDATKLFLEKFSSDIPDNYELVAEGSEVSVIDAKTDPKSKNTLLTMKLAANLLPKTDKNKIVQSIAGKSQPDAIKIIEKIPGVTRVQFETKPSIFAPIVKLLLPFKKENINVLIVRD